MLGPAPSGRSDIDKEYWYFTTGAACTPNLAGHFSSVFHSQGNCFAVEGAPMWGLPAGPPDPSVVCGADNRPQNITGSYVVHGKGSRIACTAARSAEPMVAVETNLTLVTCASTMSAISTARRRAIIARATSIWRCQKRLDRWLPAICPAWP
jgi:hypothetical protein